MKADALALVNSFKVNGSFPGNVHASLVPFDIMVGVGDARSSWAQTTVPSCNNTAVSSQCSGLNWMKAI